MTTTILHLVVPDTYLPVMYFETRVTSCRSDKAFHSALQNFYFVLLFLFIVMNKGGKKNLMFCSHTSSLCTCITYLVPCTIFSHASPLAVATSLAPPESGLPGHLTTLFLPCDRFSASYFIPYLSTWEKSTKPFMVPTFQHGINALLGHRGQLGLGVGGPMRHRVSPQFCFLIPAKIPVFWSAAT